MTLEQFRILHSTLIEHYQFIEAHLDGIYAAISGKPFMEGIREVEKDSLSGVIREIRETNKSVFTEDTYRQLRQIVDRRNFWCHSCYFELSFDLQTGGPAKVRDVQRLFEDLENAKNWREQLLKKKISLLEKQRQR